MNTLWWFHGKERVEEKVTVIFLVYCLVQCIQFERLQMGAPSRCKYVELRKQKFLEGPTGGCGIDVHRVISSLPQECPRRRETHGGEFEVGQIDPRGRCSLILLQRLETPFSSSSEDGYFGQQPTAARIGRGGPPAEEMK